MLLICLKMASARFDVIIVSGNQEVNMWKEPMMDQGMHVRTKGRPASCYSFKVKNLWCQAQGVQVDSIKL